MSLKDHLTKDREAAIVWPMDDVHLERNYVNNFRN